MNKKTIELLSQYSKKFNWFFSFPIPIEMIIEKYLGYSLDTFNADENILGVIDQINKVIYTNENAAQHFKTYPGSFEFILAHEVGHLDLHCNFSNNQPGTINKQVPLVWHMDTEDFKEIQANKYAAAILMPKELVKNTLNNVNIYNWPTLYKIAKS